MCRVVASLLLGSPAPPTRAWTKAALTLSDALGFGVPYPLAVPVRRRAVTVDGTTGDLYLPGRPGPPMVMLSGAVEEGKDDPRFVRLATAVARSGRLVFVPDLELARKRLVRADIERIVRAVAALHHRLPYGTRVGMVGISYGGSLGLVAAADPRLKGRLAQVVTFGAYYDVLGVIQAAATGFSLVGQRRLPWMHNTEAAQVLRLVSEHLVGEGEYVQLARAFARGREPAALPRELRAVYNLVTCDDPDRTAELAHELGAHARAFIGDFSPRAVADRITVPVVALHSRHDPAVPYAELLRMKEGMPHVTDVTLKSFTHVDLDGGAPLKDRVGDARAMWRFAALVLDQPT